MALHGVLAALLVASASFAQDDAAKLDKAFSTLATFTEGADAGDINYLSDQVVEAAKDRSARTAMEKRLIRFLETQGDATFEGKSIACRHLVIVGSPACVPVLAKLLPDEKLSHMARYVLERIPGEAASDALRAALPNVGDKLKIGMIHSLGRRGDVKCVDQLIKLAGGGNEELAAVAIQALAKIDSEKAAKAVASARSAAQGNLRVIASDAYIILAERYRATGRADKAAKIYEELLAETESVMNRVAALQGLTATRGEKAVPALIKALGDRNGQITAAAITGLREVPGAAATKAIAAELPRQSVALQQSLLLVLGDRGDSSAQGAVTVALKSPDAGVRAAAADALIKVGDASAVSVLAELAAKDADQETKVAARTALERMASPGVNAGIVAALKDADAAVKIELIAALGARGAADGVPALLKTARDDNESVRIESLKVLRKVADGRSADAVVALIPKATPGAEMDEARNAAVAACRKIEGDSKQAQPVLRVLAGTQDVPVKCALLRTLGEIGDSSALDTVASAARDANAEVRDAAIRALTDWPNSAPLTHLEKLAKDASTDTQRVLALRGFIRAIEMAGDRVEKERVALYASAMNLATRADEKKLVLAKVGDLRSQGALDLAKQYAGDEALRDAADLAAKKIEENMQAPAGATASHNAGKAQNAIDNNPGTRWDTGGSQQGGEWFLLDLGTEKTITKLVLDTTGSGGDYPRGYEVYISTTKENFGGPLVKGSGDGPITTINIPGKIGRYIKIVQTGKVDGLFWSIHELKVESQAP